jgi:hypothetical protein
MATRIGRLPFEAGLCGYKGKSDPIDMQGNLNFDFCRWYLCRPFQAYSQFIGNGPNASHAAKLQDFAFFILSLENLILSLDSLASLIS